MIDRFFNDGDLAYWLGRAEPHPDRSGHEPPYSCGCVACGLWRSARVRPGRLCRPATQDPSRTKPGTIPAWPLNCWGTTGWGFRLEVQGIKLVTVVGAVDPDDKDNAGHLDCVVVLTCEREAPARHIEEVVGCPLKTRVNNRPHMPLDRIGGLSHEEPKQPV